MTTNYAGTHLILDLYGAQNLDSFTVVTKALLDATKAIGATVLDINTHYFEPQGGVTGVVLLAESHMSIHTWPEHKYAAVDIFVCGMLDPTKAIEVLEQAFQPTRVERTDLKRGLHE